MKDTRLGSVEAQFADIIWSKQPISSTELAKISGERLKWKKTTAYTVLKRLCDKGLFKNEGGTVTALISKDEYYAARSENFVEETFGGSLPAFLAAFTTRKSLSPKEVEELRQMISKYGEV